MEVLDQTLEDLKTVVLDLIQDLSEIFTLPNEKSDLIIIEIFFKRIPKEKMMYRIVRDLLPLKSHIENRSLNFFANNIHLFINGLPQDKINYYQRSIIVDNRLSSDDVDVIWEYIDTMIALAETYKKFQ